MVDSEWLSLVVVGGRFIGFELTNKELVSHLGLATIVIHGLCKA